MGKESRDDQNKYQKVPVNPKTVKNLFEAENFRKRVEQQIVSKVSKIQNAALGEAKIRELNDDINNSLRIKS